MEKTIKLQPLTKREMLIEYLNLKRYNPTLKSMKDIIDDFKIDRKINIPQSTAYRIVKQWIDEQNKIKQQQLSTRVSDKLIEIFDS